MNAQEMELRRIKHFFSRINMWKKNVDILQKDAMKVQNTRKLPKNGTGEKSLGGLFGMDRNIGEGIRAGVYEK